MIGYSVSEPAGQILHWLYVKDDYRGFGYGKKLLHETTREWTPTRPWHYTHRTNASEGFLKHLYFNWSPVLARTKPRT